MTSNKQVIDQRKQYLEAYFKAGGGMWFSNTDSSPFIVSVRFYPRKKLYLHKLVDYISRQAKDDTVITLKELNKNYHRLRV